MDTPRPGEPELKTVPVPYSKENIDSDKRQSQVEAIRNEKGYDKKTPEGKLALSAKWIQRAGLSPAQVDKVWKSIGIEDPKNKDEVTQKVAEWQQKNNLVGKDGKGDGILGWATLEALDTVIENEDKKYDTDNKNAKGKDEGYGLARSGYHEKKNAEQAQQGANDVLAQQRAVKRMLNESQRQTSESTANPVEPAGQNNKEASPADSPIVYDKNEINKIVATEGRTEGAQKKLIPFYKDSPDKFITDPATNGFPIFSNAENLSAQDMTAELKKAGLNIPAGTSYQKVDGKWYKFSGDNIYNVGNKGEFQTNENPNRQIKALAIRNKFTNPEDAQTKLAEFYKDNPKAFFTDKATDGLPIFQDKFDYNQVPAAHFAKLGIKIEGVDMFTKRSDGWYSMEKQNSGVDDSFDIKKITAS